MQDYLDRVFQKDVMDLLKELPNQSIDIVYGAPDYNVGVRYNDRSYTRGFDEYIEWYIEVAQESPQALKNQNSHLNY